MKTKEWWNGCVDLHTVAHARWEIAELLKSNTRAETGRVGGVRKPM